MQRRNTKTPNYTREKYQNTKLYKTHIPNMAMVYEYGDAIPKHQTMQGRNVDFLSNKRPIDMGEILYKGGNILQG